MNYGLWQLILSALVSQMGDELKQPVQAYLVFGTAGHSPVKRLMQGPRTKQEA
jgi:hypothetical protein